jgi:hypothetical protein
MKTNIIVILLLAVFFTACSDDYKKGYESGYSDGERTGYNSGYSKGKSDGYKEGEGDGYIEGTKTFVKDSIFPSLGLTLIIFISIFILIVLYFLLKDPIKRKLETNRSLLEQEREIKTLKKKIEVFVENEEKIQKVKVHDLLYEIFGESKVMVSNMRKDQIIKEIKDQYELKLLEASMSESTAIVNKNKDAIATIQMLPKELDKERKELIKILKKKI